jgi:acetamidase/formamidase
MHVRMLHHRDGHHGWDRARPPVMEIAPGDEVELTLADCFGGQLGPDADGEAVAALELDRANPLTGPVRVAGAAAGDVLAVHVLEVAVGPVGWTTLIPGFGLLADEFPEPYVVNSELAGIRIAFGDVAVLPSRPFIGTIGTVPAAPGPHDVIPPRRVGGNLDCRDVRPGATLLLPVEVDGGMLSAGDPHGAQGDGEVCGTAVETTATVRLRVDVRPGMELPAPQLQLPQEGTRPVGPRHLTMGVGPDLHEGARDATRAMIDHLVTTAGLDARDAYALCSAAGNLRIAEVVDAPNWVVAMELDLSLLA